MGTTAELVILRFAGEVSLTRVDVALVLEVHEVEQLVSQDGTADADADRVVQGLAEFQTLREVAEFVLHTILGAHETVVVVVVIDADMGGVGTALGDGVDGTTGEAAVTDIERRDVDGHGLESIQRDGATASRQVAADTEGVVEGSTVNGDVGRTVVTTTDGQTVGSSGSLRRQGQHVVEATADGGQGHDLLIVDGRSGTGAVAVHAIGDGFGSHGDFTQTDSLFVHANVQDLGLTQGGSDTLLDDGLETDHAVLNLVGTAGTDVQQAVVTVGISYGIVLRAGGSVRGNNGGTRKGGSIVVRDFSTDA